MSSGQTAPIGDLVALGTRIRSMLLCRAVLVAAVPAAALMAQSPAETVATMFGCALVWLLLTVPSVVVPRLGRTPAMIVFHLCLLLDGTLLCIAWRELGGLQGPGWYLVWLHGVAVTLLASFRTGVKLAIWQGLLALVSLEATAAGLWGPVGPVPMAELAMYQGMLVATVLVVAGFAAVNERELRRRRLDSDLLRRLGYELAGERSVEEIRAMLARFATQDLLVNRSVVVTYRQEPTLRATDATAAVLTGPGDETTFPTAPEELDPRSVLARAMERAETLLQTRLSPQWDPWLAELLPGARDIVVVPFALDQISGVLVMECRRSWSRRVERRIRDTAEQAVAHAAMALGRAVLSERIQSAAHTDGLTGLANRRLFDSRLVSETERSRFTGEPVSLLMVDLDHFKQLNDRHGHQAGDEVLRQAAAVVGANCGESGLAARYGGEEFAVILSGCDTDAAAGIAESIRAALVAGDTQVPVTASIGVATSPGHGLDGPALLRAADAALYVAKADGRNRVVRAEPAGRLAA